MKRNFCWACNALRNGVKSKIAFEHTCGLETGAMPPNEHDDKDFQEWLDRCNMRGVNISQKVKYRMFINQTTGKNKYYPPNTENNQL